RRDARPAEEGRAEEVTGGRSQETGDRQQHRRPVLTGSCPLSPDWLDMSTCSYCRGPLAGRGHAGRPWPGRPAAVYCCFGCLSLGEQQQQEAAAPASGWKPGGLGVRLAVALLVVGQSMIFGLALNLHDDVPAEARWFTQTV